MANSPKIFGLTIVLLIGIHIRSVHTEVLQNETLNKANDTNEIHTSTISTPPITVAMEKLAALPVRTIDTTDMAVAMTDNDNETKTTMVPSTSLAATEPITDTSTIKTTTTGDPQELLIPPASVNASIAQMFNNVSHKTGQIIIR